MRYALALLTLGVITGCAAKKQQVSETPGAHHYKGCKEVAVNAKNGEVTILCPPQEGK